LKSTKQQTFKRLFDAANAIIFDFDGVLADSEKWHFLTYSEVFARYGHTVDETEYYKYWTSLGLGAKGEIERHHLNLDPIAVRDEKRPLFSQRCRDGSIELYPEAHEILHRLSETNKIITVASGTASYDIEPILKNAGVRGLFAEIIGCDTVPSIKPAPDLFLAMLDRLELPGSDCLVIEDAEKGVQAANSAGIPVIVIRTDETRAFDFRDADLTLDSHAELLEAIRRAIPTMDV
jgi:HAD superfamily hydrolase (TIGR01509 family)